MNNLPLGDTSLMYGMELPACKRCGYSLTPRVWFGYVIGWRCPNCNPEETKFWSGPGTEHREGK